MSTTRKIAIGLGVASGALLAAWLLTGDRKKKTKEFLAKKADTIKKSFKPDSGSFDDSDGDVGFRRRDVSLLSRRHSVFSF